MKEEKHLTVTYDKTCGFEDLCEIYLLYFDEVIGHVFLLTCPKTINTLEKTKKSIIMHHPIWFLDFEDETTINRIDLEYKGVMYFARKFLVMSERLKKRSGSTEDLNDTVIVIITLSAELDIFGGELLNLLTNNLMSKFHNLFYKLIESEIAKLEIIKSRTVLELIEKGEKIKEEIRQLITSVCKSYFSSVIRQTDATSIKLQKAISYMIFKGIDIDHIVRESRDKEFSNIRLFDYDKISKKELETKERFELMNIHSMIEEQEFEILLKNIHNKPLNNLRVRITYIQDFFEKEILNERIEQCLPNEELLLVAPIPEKINEFVLTINKDLTKKKLYTRNIKLDLES
ncbi:MAG: hypothetical protein ACFE9R_01840 [Candidatus Hermodarchaeota archaeon]